MNLRNVLKTYSLLRTLNDDETALLNTLRGMNEGERELLVEELSSEKKSSKKAGDVKKRNLEHCGVCDYTRRAAHHKDTSHKDYHEFHSRTERPPKSQRASSIQQQIQGRGKTSTRTSGDDSDALCCYKFESGMVCESSSGNPVHDPTQGYAGYHPFVSPSPARNAGGRSSSPTTPPDGSKVNSEVVTETVSSATGD